MNRKKIIQRLVLIGAGILHLAITQAQSTTRIVVPISGNTWQMPIETRALSRADGIRQWDKESKFSTYVRFAKTGEIDLELGMGTVKEATKIQLAVGSFSKTVSVSLQQANSLLKVGKIAIPDTGYAVFQIWSKEDKVLPEIKSFQMTGDSALIASSNYVVNNDDNYFYWGRRGPSVHLAYSTPVDTDIEYYYNEITVPKGEDVIGSYYMANGFSQGYFGIQVNSESERRILFSVWSPFHTDNPKEIPDDQKIILQAKGKDVYTGEFGNEGSGGQSFLRYNWITGNTYRFLLRGRPVENGYTEFTAWLYAPEKGDWQLIAQFLRPKTNTYLKGFHSFLENFSPSQGHIERKVIFSNQWVRDVNGRWHECTEAKFTADATARKGYRMDYAGGVIGNDFYLQNCGFFNDYTVIDSRFSRPDNRRMPHVDVAKLPME